MNPAAKVLAVAVVVLVVAHVIKYWSARDEREAEDAETYIPWIHQEFETIAPRSFAVTPPALPVNAELTQVPVLTQVPSDMPAVLPTLVPTLVPAFPQPSTVPTFPQVTSLPA